MFAKVIFDHPFVNKKGSLSYGIPKELEKEIVVGSIVKVPFKHSFTSGVVLEILEDKHCDLPKLKPVFEVSKYKINNLQIEFANWLKNYYLSGAAKAFKLFLPSSAWKSGIRKADNFILLPLMSDEEIKNYILKNKKNSRQINLLKTLLEKKLLLFKEWDGSVIKNLLEKKVIKKINYEKGVSNNIIKSKYQKSELTENQNKIVKDIEESGKNIHLLHGLSASGKSEVYLHLALENIKKGKQVLIIAPEIALTQHLISYLQNFFPGKVAHLHSKSSNSKKNEIWIQLQQKRIQILVGSRISLFYPFNNLGLIVVDEEQEWSYKSEQSPRYHTREAAIKLAELSNCKILLGSATPSIYSYHQALNNNNWQLHSLNKDLNQFESQAKILDLREEFHRGNKSVFAEELQIAMQKTLEKKEQSIIIINRRGFAKTVSCRDCGLSSDCLNCKTPFTLYKNKKGNHLFCHHCGKTEIYHTACNNCGSINVKELGIGIQKVLEESKKLFPQAKIMQLDGSVIKKGHLESLLPDLQNADIIIGTQLLAKGFDLERVTLSCILLADLELNFPDFNSSEKAYQLFVQTRGRSGRHKNGAFYLQTYQPDHPVIQASCLPSISLESYEKFYQEEISIRKNLNLPPILEMVRVNVVTETEKEAEEKIHNLLSQIRKIADEEEKQSIMAAPDLIYRKKNKYNWHLIFCSKNPQKILKKLNLDKVKVDINPNSSI